MTPQANQIALAVVELGGPLGGGAPPITLTVATGGGAACRRLCAPAATAACAVSSGPGDGRSVDRLLAVDEDESDDDTDPQRSARGRSRLSGRATAVRAIGASAAAG